MVKKRFVYKFILAVFAFALSAPSCVAASDVPSDDIIKAAKEGIVVFLKDSRLSGNQELGFETQVDVDNAELGEGFQIFTIHPDQLLDETNPHDLKDIVFPTGQWEFFVVAGDKVKSLLRVGFVNGKWTPVGIGSSIIAMKMSSLIEAWPKSSGYSYRFIRVYQANADIIELSRNGKILGFIPLNSYFNTDTERRTAQTFAPRNLRQQEEVLKVLRPAVRANIEKYKNRGKSTLERPASSPKGN